MLMCDTQGSPHFPSLPGVDHTDFRTHESDTDPSSWSFIQSATSKLPCPKAAGPNKGVLQLLIGGFHCLTVQNKKYLLRIMKSDRERYSEVDKAGARSTVLGTLTTTVLVGTFVLDLGLPMGVSVWPFYCLAIVLALQWKGRSAIAAVSTISIIFMVLDFWLGPRGDLETDITNRAIGAVTITGVALICLYIDWRRRRIGQQLTTTSLSRSRLRLFLNSLSDAAVVLTDVRGRVTEWSAGAQQLTGYPRKQTIGQPLFRRLTTQSTPAVRWSHIFRQARLEGEAVREESYQCRDGSWCWMHLVIRPLRNRFGRLRGYSLVMHDLTNRESAEETSNESSETRSL